MTFPIVMNLGVGRSGTTFAHNQLKILLAGRAHVLHEDINARTARVRQYFRCVETERVEAALSEPTVRQWLERVRALAAEKPVVITGGTTSHLAPAMRQLFGDRLRTIHVYRHPVNVAAAMYVGAWSTNWSNTRSFDADPTGWVLTPDDPHVRFRSLAPAWAGLGPFARIAYNWLERTAAALEFTRLYPEVRHADLKAEVDVFRSDRYIQEIVRLLELNPTGLAELPTTSQNAGWGRSLEERPLGEAWRQIFDVPEVIELATRLGYGFEPSGIEANTRRYQLPAGVGPWLRHHLRYWQARRRIVTFLRARALIPQGQPVLGGGKPRSSLSALGDLLPSVLRRGSGKDAK